MVISFQTLLGRCLTESVRKTARDLLYSSRPCSIRYLTFFPGHVSLNGRSVRSVIPVDISILDVGYDGERDGWFYFGIIPWVPTVQTAVMLYFYLLRPYLTDGDYFYWIYKVQEKLNAMGYDRLEFTFGSRCFIYPKTEEKTMDDIMSEAYDDFIEEEVGYSKWLDLYKRDGVIVGLGLSE